jgi:hypothetical protein
MSTYGELTTEVLGVLDQPLTTTGDVLTNVQAALKRLTDRLVVDLRPDTMLETSITVTVTDSTTSIPLDPTGFTITNIDIPFTLLVNTTPSTSTEFPAWRFKAYRSWLRAENTLRGSGLEANTWTQAPDGSILLYPWPESGATYEAKLTYYKKTAAFNSSNSPELPEMHQGTLVYGAALQFPQFFQGDRQFLLPVVSKQFTEGLRLLQTKSDPASTRSMVGIAAGVR